MGKSTLKVHKVNLDDLPLEFQWYPLKVVFNYEREAAKNIRNNMIARGYGENINDVIVPLLERIEQTIDKKGNVKTKTKYDKIYGFDGYIWIHIILNSEVWSIVRNSTGVAGWLNADGRPLPLLDHEIVNIKKICNLYEAEKKAAAENFKGNIGDLVKITDGPMLGLEGNISEINEEKKIVKLKMPNNMTFQVEFYQVEKV